MAEDRLDILLVEDEAAHLEAIRRTFHGSRVEFRVAGSLQEYRSQIETKPPDLAMLDLSLPDGRAVEVIKWPPEENGFPVLVMTSTGDEHVAVEALRAGAMDYIVKSTDAFSTMPRVVERALREWELLRARRDAQVALARSEARYRDLVENLEDVVYTIDAEARIQYMSSAAEHVYGYPLNQMIGHSFGEFIHPDDLPGMIEYYQRALQGHVAPFEFRGLDSTGNVRYLRSTGRARQENGVVVGVTGVLIDVTGEILAAREKEQLQDHLRQSQKLEAVGRLAGGVAHDFNNLLSVIINYSGFVLDELDESDPIRADVVEIRNAGHRASALTRQLLAFSRKQMLEPEVLSLNRVIQGIENMLRRLLGEDIDIVMDLADDLGSVEADPGQIEQVVVNLAVNARDAMPRGGKLTIETTNVELDREYADQHIAVDPGPYTMLSVSDTGLGMDAQTRQQIFEPFFTTKERDQGTGLGLATVYGIVKQSGGNIWVYSEPEHGTTFKIFLPRVDAPAVVTRHTPPPLTISGAETILLVEDEDAVRRAAERILRNAGYTVLAASNGAEALALHGAPGVTIDLLLADVVMPGISGMELARQLAKIRPGLKVLFMSGYTDNAVIRHGVHASRMRLVGKPFSASELTRKVRDTLDSEPALEAPTEDPPTTDR